MSQPLIVKDTITFRAPAAKVWNAFTNPEETKKYMFGCEALSDWKEGSPLIWKGTFNGVELVAVKGTIKKIQPGKYLEYTVIDPNNPKIPDLPENYLTITCRSDRRRRPNPGDRDPGRLQYRRRWRQPV
jgi:uncharacterized protein YndB with AHSA1/START domain